MLDESKRAQQTQPKLDAPYFSSNCIASSTPVLCNAALINEADQKHLDVLVQLSSSYSKRESEARDALAKLESAYAAAIVAATNAEDDLKRAQAALVLAKENAAAGNTAVMCAENAMKKACLDEQAQMELLQVQLLVY